MPASNISSDLQDRLDRFGMPMESAAQPRARASVPELTDEEMDYMRESAGGFRTPFPRMMGAPQAGPEAAQPAPQA